MKKNFFWLSVLMLGLSCALWTGCSDDDDDDNKNGNGNGDTPGDVTGAVTENPKTGAAYWVKAINVEGVGEVDSTRVELARDKNNWVTKITQTSYVDGAVDGTSVAEISYPENSAVFKYKAAVSLKNTGTEEEPVYESVYTNVTMTCVLNDKGYVTKASAMYDAYEDPSYGPQDAQTTVYEFTHTDGRLTKISYGEAPYSFEPLKVTYADGDWKTFVTQDADENDYAGDCVVSEHSNNLDVDMNLLGYVYGSVSDLDYIILAGLLPKSAHLMASVKVAEMEWVDNGGGGVDPEPEPEPEPQPEPELASLHQVSGVMTKGFETVYRNKIQTPVLSGDKVTSFETSYSGDTEPGKKITLRY